MRIIWGGALVLALTGCANEADDGAPETAALEAALYAAQDGRSGLCVGAGNAASFILYADEGDANCMAEGRVEGDGDELAFVPRGDEQCRIPLSIEGKVARLDAGNAACDYYCGGDARLDARELVADHDAAVDPVDPAGEAIC
ncbi:hypothetical protein [Sphingomicrobium astaxanthinifaciens]|uniref:hypothetical protein n=1 Tax=Sphingomicrobium astaxanthinifaciens TaxID=1227949 RepID=UPI001FCA8337|nr:hypothetical protein [Sphingomicrobium astaxanthinifaciens]MCJ7420640.1 hypothetical protein [Sphingomicrobium astaxanthinifaciens]